MHGFEIMLGPYAIAHLKVALELHHQGVEAADVKIYLTDTLEHPAPQQQLETIADPVSAEGVRAAELKADHRFTVVIGNPPYDREQRKVGDTGKRKGGVVRHGAPGVDPLFDAITEPMSAAGQGVHLKNAYNDYVYFWRWSTWHATELTRGPGIVALITASSYLEGVSMGGLRHHLRNAFCELKITDLGGDGRIALVDENVFDIQTPVAVAVGIRSSAENPNPCRIGYRAVEGTRIDKFGNLAKSDLESTFTTVEGDGLDKFLPVSDHEYYSWPEITNLFPWAHSGSQVKRTWPIAETKSILRRRWKVLVDTVPRNRIALFKESRDRKIKSRVPSLLKNSGRLVPVHDLKVGDRPEAIERYGFRSFDRQWVIADMRVADFPRPVLWQVRSDQQVYLTTFTATKFSPGTVLSVSPYVPDEAHFFGSHGGRIIPLFRDAEGSAPNVTDRVAFALEEVMGETVEPSALIAYVYGMCGTGVFFERHQELLRESAGPLHVPITTDLGLFEEMEKVGRDLLWWHTWGERFKPCANAKLPKGRARERVAVSGMPEDFDYDEESESLRVGTGVFGPVSKDVWEFQVSGLRVLRSWLRYRMKNRGGRKSSPLDDIRPTRWTQSEELLLLLSIIEHTIEVTPTAAELLERIVNGPLILASELPTPTAAERKPPRA